MTALATRIRRALRRRPHLQRWYLAYVALWMFPFGGLLLIGWAMGNDAPNARVTPIDVYIAYAADIWPPHSVFGAFVVMLWWSPVLLAPLGLTRPRFKELY